MARRRVSEVGGIRDEFERRLFDMVNEQGAAVMDYRPLIEWLRSQGVSAKSGYRWIDKAITDGSMGLRLQQEAQRKAAERKAALDPLDPAAAAVAAEAREKAHAGAPDPRAAAAAERAGEAVAVLPDIAVVAEEQMGVVAVQQRLNECVVMAKRIMAHAQTEDGKIRNSKLALAGSEHLRRSVETMVRVHEAVRDMMAVEEFHQAVFSALKEESPALAERVLARLRQVQSQWARGLR